MYFYKRDFQVEPLPESYERLTIQPTTRHHHFSRNYQINDLDPKRVHFIYSRNLAVFAVFIISFIPPLIVIFLLLSLLSSCVHILYSILRARVDLTTTCIAIPQTSHRNLANMIPFTPQNLQPSYLGKSLRYSHGPLDKNGLIPPLILFQSK